MFNNPALTSLCRFSDEQNLRLHKEDWQKILDANKEFFEDPGAWKGNRTWGKYLLNLLGEMEQPLDFTSSIELCCGNGFLFFSFRELFDLTKNAWFIDLSQSQCNAFRQRCAYQGIESPNILCGDIGDMPFKADTFSCVYGHSFLHHLPYVGLSLREIYRVLQPGGKFVAFHEPTPTANFFERFPRSLWRWHSNIACLTDIWLIKPVIILRLLQESGFQNIRIQPNRMLSSVFVVPWEKVFYRLIQNLKLNGFPRLRMYCDRIEHTLPGGISMKLSPSISVVATK